MTSRYLLPFVHKCHATIHFQRHYIIVRQRFLLEKCGIHLCTGLYSYRTYLNYVLKIGICRMNEQIWMNKHWTVALFTLLEYWCVIPRIPILWRHEKVVLQRIFRATSCHSFITTMWWYNNLCQTPCIFNFYGNHIECKISIFITAKVITYQYECINYALAT